MKEHSETFLPHLRIHTVINGSLIASRGYDILQSKDMGRTWMYSGTVPVSAQKKVLSRVRFVSRALRAGIHQIKQIHNGKILICCRNDFFLSDLSLSGFERIEIQSHFFQLLDNSICVTSDFTYFGEYIPNARRNRVNIFRTRDGETWDIIYSFPQKSIKHVHLLQFDPFSQKIWFSTGDSDAECVLGYSNADFSDCVIVGKNHQNWRSLELLFTSDKIFWGTDDPQNQNWLVSLDRTTQTMQKIARFDGPVYNLKRVSPGYIAVTATEGGRGEWDDRSHLWFSADLEQGSWKDIKSYQKDRLPYIFGFGRLLFGTEMHNSLYISGLALKHVDDCTIVISLDTLRQGSV
jgi:hypothetical protein